MKTFDYTYDDLFNPCLKAFQALGGSGTNTEIEEQVTKILNLTDDEVADIHRGNTSKLSYRLAWSRNYLKRDGLLENSSRSVWSLTAEGRKLESVGQRDLVRRVQALSSGKTPKDTVEAESDVRDGVEELDWQDALVTTVKKMEPEAFERLSQRLLRELGFKNVEVTGRSGDGGIDGKGILNIGSVITFRNRIPMQASQGNRLSECCERLSRGFARACR